MSFFSSRLLALVHTPPAEHLAPLAQCKRTGGIGDSHADIAVLDYQRVDVLLLGTMISGLTALLLSRMAKFVPTVCENCDKVCLHGQRYAKRR